MIRSASAPVGDMAFIAAVAAYGQLLRGDTNLGRFSFADARVLAQRARTDDYWRREFVGLTERAQRLRFAGGDGSRAQPMMSAGVQLRRRRSAFASALSPS